MVMSGFYCGSRRSASSSNLFDSVRQRSQMSRKDVWKGEEISSANMTDRFNPTGRGQHAGIEGVAAASPQNPHAEEQARAAANRTGIFINGKELTPEQASGMAAAYRYAPIPGRYWYDSRSGAWGFEGHETAGFLLPGYNFGPLAADASHGNTGVFINGRQINMIEAMRIRQTFGAVYRGRWWLDGRTGYYGLEGNSVPVGNVIAALQAQRSGRGGDNFWSSTTARGNDNGQSGYVDVGGAIVGYDR